MDKKGMLGLDSIAGVVTWFLFLGVLAVGVFLALSVVTTTDILPQKTMGSTGFGPSLTFVNDTMTLNDTGGYPATVKSLSSVTLYNVIIINASDNKLFSSGNYTISGNKITWAAGGDANANNTAVEVSASYTHKVDNDGVTLATNVTAGTRDFFAKAPTVFVILGAVVIVLAVVLIIRAVGGFSAVKTTESASEL